MADSFTGTHEQAEILDGLVSLSTVLTAINSDVIRVALLAGAAALRAEQGRQREKDQGAGLAAAPTIPDVAETATASGLYEMRIPGTMGYVLVGEETKKVFDALKAKR